MIKCIAVDDEPLALSLLEDYIGKISFLQLVAKCGDAFEAQKALRENEVDLIFIDIQMPGLTGLTIRGCIDRINALCTVQRRQGRPGRRGNRRSL